MVNDVEHEHHELSSVDGSYVEDVAGDIAFALGQLTSEKHAVYSCGGSIPIEVPSATEASTDDRYTKSGGPVSLYWSSPSGGSLGTVKFPVEDSGGQAQLESLCRDCQPASFGLQGQDVLDETYRKATKLDRSDFAVDFCPYELGIVNVIAQMLLPETRSRGRHQGVLAELYKLNIYTGPSGFFKPHVDTPRAKNQFGSLVVNLPCRHEGGQLVVRHAGREKVFDWSSSKTKENVISWAAFYSDCEHEIKEVTEGNRVTLTYNLYSVSGSGNLAGNCPILDVRSLPLHSEVQKVLANKTFMTNGGVLGIFCTHCYAHHSHIRTMLPQNLKGADMATYEVFKALCLDVRMVAILDDDEILDEARSYNDDMSDVSPYSRARAIGKIEMNRDDSSEIDEVLDGWTRDVSDICWLNGPERGLGELGYVRLAYGNQADLVWYYTYAAILVNIPTAEKRMSTEHQP